MQLDTNHSSCREEYITCYLGNIMYENISMCCLGNIGHNQVHMAYNTMNHAYKYIRWLIVEQISLWAAKG